MIRCYILSLLALFMATQTHAITPEKIYSPPVIAAAKPITQGVWDIDPKVHPLWVHYIININQKRSTITLENGTKWKLGMLYANLLEKKWKVGDQVTLCWYEGTVFLDTQIKNYTRQSYAWAQKKDAIQTDAPSVVFISNIPNELSLELSDGTIVTSKYPWMFRSCQTGDIVMTLYGKGIGTTPYVLWDVTQRYILFELSVQ